MINNSNQKTQTKKRILLILKLLIPALSAGATVLIVKYIPGVNIWPLSNWSEYIFYILSMAVYLVVVLWSNDFKKIQSLINWLSYTSIFLILFNTINWYYSSPKLSIDFPSIVLISFNLYLFSISLYWLIPMYLSNKMSTDKVNNLSDSGELTDKFDKLKDLSEKQDKILPFIRIIVPTIFTISITWGLLSLTIINLSGNHKDSSWTSWLSPTGTLFSALITVIGAVIGTYTIYLNGKEQRLFDENKFKNEYARQTTESKRLASEFADVQAREKEEFHKEQAQKLMLSLDENYYKATQSNDIEKIDLAALSNLTKNWEIYSSDFNEINRIKNIQIFNILNKIFSTYKLLSTIHYNNDFNPEYYSNILQRTFDIGSYNPLTETKNSSIVNTFKEVSLDSLEFVNGWIYNLDFSNLNLSNTIFSNISFCNCVLPDRNLPKHSSFKIDYIIASRINKSYYFDFDVSQPVQMMSNIYSNTGVQLLTSWNSPKIKFSSGIYDYRYIVNRQYAKMSEVFNSTLAHNENSEYQFVLFSDVTFYQHGSNVSTIFRDCLFVDCNLKNIKNAVFLDCKFYFSSNYYEPSTSDNVFHSNLRRINGIFGKYITLDSAGDTTSVNDLVEILNSEIDDRLKLKINNYLVNTREKTGKFISCSLVEISRVDSEIRDKFLDIFYLHEDRFSKYLGDYSYSRQMVFSDFSPSYIFLNSIRFILTSDQKINTYIQHLNESLFENLD